MAGQVETVPVVPHPTKMSSTTTLGTLGAMVDASVRSGSDAVALVQGPVGSGRSWILGQLAARQRRHGRSLLRVSPEPPGAAHPYGSIVGAIRTALRRGDAPLAHRIDEMDEVSLDTTGSLRLETVVGSVIDDLRDDGLLVVLVDDVERCDAGSVSLLLDLHQRRRRYPLLTIATANAGSTGIAAWWKDGSVDASREHQVLRLAAAESGEIAELVADILGGRPQPALVERIQRESGGRLSLVRHILLAWQEQGMVSDGDGGHLVARELDTRLDPLRAETLVRRHLPDDPLKCSIAEALAFLGGARPERMELVATLAGASVAETVRTLDGLVTHEVLERGANGQLNFTAPLIRSALVGGIGAARMWHWHALCVEWLRSSPGSARTRELAEHLVQVAEPGDEQAVLDLVAAARQETERDPARAVTWWRRVQNLVTDSDPRRGPAIVGLSRSLYLAGQFRESAELGWEAVASMAPGDERQTALNVAVAASEALGERDEAILRQKNEESSRMLAFAAHLHAQLGHVETASRSLEDPSLVDAGGSAADLVHAHMHLAHTAGLLGRSAAMMDHLERASDGSQDLPPPAAASAALGRAFLLAVHGDPRADAALTSCAELVAASPGEVFHLELSIVRLAESFRAGRWDEALDEARGVAASLGTAQAFARLGLVTSIEAEILANRGQLTAARRILTERPVAPETEAAHAWTLAGVDLVAGHLASAGACLTQALSRTTVPRFRSGLLIRLAEVEIADNDPRAAERVLTDVLDAGHGGAPGLMWIEALRLSGLINKDVALLEELLTTEATVASPWATAKVRFTLGQLDRDPDRDFREAYKGFHLLGADLWRRRVAQEMRDRGLKVPRQRKDTSSDLSDGEIVVARLVQEGCQNRRIATTLSISVKTVEAYLTRIYAKLGCSTRLELARAMDSLDSIAGA